MSTMYTGTSGEEYLQHRAKRTPEHSQRYAARVFLPYIQPAMRVLDFGCGTGGILSNIPCRERVGVEVNELSVAQARSRGIVVHTSIDEVASDSCDAVISHHCLEHVADPHSKISELFRVLKPGGRLIIVVPCELPRTAEFKKWTPALDVHLYSWNCRSMGNLVRDCGFNVEETSVLGNGYSNYNKWLLNVPALFRIAEGATARLLGRFQLRCVATKPARVPAAS